MTQGSKRRTNIEQSCFPHSAGSNDKPRGRAETLLAMRPGLPVSGSERRSLRPVSVSPVFLLLTKTQLRTFLVSVTRRRRPIIVVREWVEWSCKSPSSSCRQQTMEPVCGRKSKQVGLRTYAAFFEYCFTFLYICIHTHTHIICSFKIAGQDGSVKR